MPRMNRALTLGAAATAAVLLMAGCASASAPADTGSSTSGSSAALTTLKVATISMDGAVPLFIAQEQGFFKEEGLTVETSMSPAFDGTLASVMNGQSDIGFAASPPLLNAMAKKAPIQVVAQTASAGKGLEANVNVYGDEITSPKQLEGKTVAVTSLNDLSAVGIRLLVAQAGGDPAKVNLVELPDAQRIGALVEKRIDAAAMVGPTAITARATPGIRLLVDYTDGLPQNTPLDVYFSSPTFIKEHAKQLDGFRAALDKAATYANANPDAVRAVLATMWKDVGGVEAAKEVTLMNYNTATSAAALTALQQALHTYGKLTQIVPTDTFYSYPVGK